MKKVPKYIVDKLDSYHRHSQKAEKLRVEIEQWFVKHGMEKDNSIDYPITDILVDTSVDGDIDGAISLLNIILNEIQ